MDKGPGISPEIGQALATAFMGFWAFLGGMMRSGSDWRDPKTGRFSLPLFATSIATAAVLGQIASWWGMSHHWEAGAIGVTASTLGYLGPAVVMAALRSWAKIGVPDGTDRKD